MNHFAWIAALLIVLSMGDPLGAMAPRLYNEMPSYLQPFKEKVEEQASLYPDLFFLQALDGERRVALTFDDGPGPLTPLILDVLKEHQVQATFFILGERAKTYPEVVKRMIREGHVLGNHTWSHPDLTHLSFLEMVKEELEPTSSLIRDITARYPLLLRPPYGALNDEAILFLGREGWRVINWSLDTFDWDKEQSSKEEILEKVMAYHHEGAIILMHDGGGDNNTLEVLPLLIGYLRKEGYSFDTVDRLLNLDPYLCIEDDV